MFSKGVFNKVTKGCAFKFPESELQLSWSKVMERLVLLLTYGPSVQLPLPTPNTMLMLIHPKYAHYSITVFRGRGLGKIEYWLPTTK